MEVRATTKEVTLGDRKYLLSKMDARLSCWLFTTLAGKIEDNTKFMSGLGKFPREQFDEIQALALKQVSLVDDTTSNRLFSSVIAANGRWADKDLEHNPSEVLKLTIESIMFNIEPFLDVSESTAQQ